MSNLPDTYRVPDDVRSEIKGIFDDLRRKQRRDNVQRTLFFATISSITLSWVDGLSRLGIVPCITVPVGWWLWLAWRSER